MLNPNIKDALQITLDDHRVVGEQMQPVAVATGKHPTRRNGDRLPIRRHPVSVADRGQPGCATLQLDGR